MTDSVRGIMEKTRGDLTNALRQRDLELALMRIPGVAQPAGAPGNMQIETDSEEVPNY